MGRVVSRAFIGQTPRLRPIAMCSNDSCQPPATTTTHSTTTTTTTTTTTAPPSACSSSTIAAAIMEEEEARSLTPDHHNRERLPNLFEVLSRRTLAPVCPSRPRQYDRPPDPTRVRPDTDVHRSTFSPSTFTCAMSNEASIIWTSGKSDAKGMGESRRGRWKHLHERRVGSRKQRAAG